MGESVRRIRERKGINRIHPCLKWFRGNSDPQVFLLLIEKEQQTMKKSEVPDYVQAAWKKGYTVKSDGRNHYYLYKRTSRRVNGCKNPKPEDVYVGRITPEGIVHSKVRRLDTSRVIAREYGFSKAMLQLCPENWKKTHRDNWEELLDTIIVLVSSNSYIQMERTVRLPETYREPVPACQSRLFQLISEQHNIRKEELLQLSTIQRVWVDGYSMLTSDISEKQKELLDRLHVSLEVC